MSVLVTGLSRKVSISSSVHLVGITLFPVFFYIFLHFCSIRGDYPVFPIKIAHITNTCTISQLFNLFMPGPTFQCSLRGSSRHTLLHCLCVFPPNQSSISWHILWRPELELQLHTPYIHERNNSNIATEALLLSDRVLLLFSTDVSDTCPLYIWGPCLCRHHNVYSGKCCLGVALFSRGLDPFPEL